VISLTEPLVHLDEAAGAVEAMDYFALHTVLAKRAVEASEAGQAHDARHLSLLSRICFVMLQRDDGAGPFGPIMSGPEGRTFLPQDLDPAEIAELPRILERLKTHRLRARVADILWIYGERSERFPMAKLAINEYTAIGIDEATWYHDGQSIAERALELGKRLGSATAQDVVQIEEALLAAIFAPPFRSPYLVLHFADLGKRQGVFGSKATDIADELERLSAEIEKEGDLDRSRTYAQGAGHWIRTAGNNERWMNLVIREADLWVREARARATGPNRSAMAAATLMESALQVLRQIPRKHRTDLGVDQLIDSTIREMQALNEEALEEFSVFESKPMDLTESINAAREAIAGKDITAALVGLCSVSRFASLSQEIALAEQTNKNSITALVSSRHVTSTGRVVASSASDDSYYGYPASLWRRMVTHYGFRIQIAVQGLILAAARQFREEHHITLADLEVVVRDGALLPLDRTGLIARGLLRGFQWGFGESIHILAPQLEHAVRKAMKDSGRQTTTVESGGIEKELGLSALMERTEVVEILGADLAFEIRALFCGPLGPNLRNEVAHGLLDDSTAYSPAAVYAWWFVLKLAVTPYWNRLTASYEVDEADEL
jgi:hypothetical protein